MTDVIVKGKPSLDAVCLKCGGCCRHLILAAKITNPDELEFYKARGYMQDSEGIVKIDVPLVCPHLKGNLCDCYEDRPAVCIRYPKAQLYSGILKKEDLPDGCAFKC